MKILGIIGSLSGSKTRIAMKALKFKDDVDVELIDLSTLSLEFADGRDYRDYRGDTLQLVQKIMEADGLVIGTPIFQASIPGALKNILDLLPIDSIKDKTVGLVVTAGSPRHYLVPEYQLKPIFEYMKAKVINKYVYIEAGAFYQDELVDDAILLRLEALATHVVDSIEAQQALEAKRYDF